MHPDLVVWDSHPLALGTTPQQVWIDGIPQLSEPAVASKPTSFQQAPRTPNFDLEAAAAIKYEGLPPLIPKKAKELVVFANISSIFVQDGMGGVMSMADVGEGSVVALRKGVVQCWGAAAACASEFVSEDAEWIDLEGGSIACVVTDLQHYSPILTRLTQSRPYLLWLPTWLGRDSGRELHARWHCFRSSHRLCPKHSRRERAHQGFGWSPVCWARHSVSCLSNCRYLCSSSHPR